MNLEDLMMEKDATGYEVDTLAVHIIDSVFIKPFVARKAGTFMGQHAHAHDHGTLIASGMLRVFLDGERLGDYGPGEVVTIRKHRKHVLLALEDNTIAVCIHNTHGEDEPQVTEKAVLCR